MTEEHDFNEYAGPRAEEGCTDPSGRRWIRAAWSGWRLLPPSPFLAQPESGKRISVARRWATRLRSHRW